MINRCSFESAQRSYDNRMPDDNDEPEFSDEMECPKCGCLVELEDNKGTCEKCDNECEFGF